MKYSIRQLLAVLTAIAILLAVVPQVIANPPLSDGIAGGLRVMTGQGLSGPMASHLSSIDSPLYVVGLIIGVVVLGVAYAFSVVETGRFVVRMFRCRVRG